MFHLMETGWKMERKTYFFQNLFSHIEHSNNCSFFGCFGCCCCGDDELFCFSRFAADGGFFTPAFFCFKWMRWMCSFKLAFRVNFNSHWSHSNIRSLVCNRKWQRNEFFPNVRLQIGHGILLSLQMFHLCSISWKIHSASVGVLWSERNEIIKILHWLGLCILICISKILLPKFALFASPKNFWFHFGWWTGFILQLQMTFGQI